MFLNDGWPLDKIAERLRHAPTEELVPLIPGQPDHNDALALARSFRRTSDEIESPRRRALRLREQENLLSMSGQSGLFPEQDPSVSASRRRAEPTPPFASLPPMGMKGGILLASVEIV